MTLLEQFPLFMSYCKKQFHKSISAYLAPYGILGMNAVFLRTISENPGVTMTRLTAMHKCNRATTSRAVASLEKMDMVSDDRKNITDKKYCLYLTERGRELEHGLSRHIGDYNRKVLSRLTEAEQETLKNLLIKLMDIKTGPD